MKHPRSFRFVISPDASASVRECVEYAGFALSGKRWEKEGFATEIAESTEEAPYQTSGMSWGRLGGGDSVLGGRKNPRRDCFPLFVGFELFVVEPVDDASAFADGVCSFHLRGRGVRRVEGWESLLSDAGLCWGKEAVA
jgi:hypothetical protein